MSRLHRCLVASNDAKECGFKDDSFKIETKSRFIKGLKDYGSQYVLLSSALRTTVQKTQ